MQTEYYIGIDIGATLVKMGVVARDGMLAAREEIETAKIADPRQFVTASSEAVERLLSGCPAGKDSVKAVGIGAPGWVDHERGIVRELTNVAQWNDFPLAERMEKAVGLKTFVDNDANVTAVAELVHGAGRGRKNFICLTLGTGVGGGIVVNGEIYRGAHGLAGEVGHMTLDLDGPKCACGAAGCLESYVGHRSIVAHALKLAEDDSGKYQASFIRKVAADNPESITAKLLAQEAEKGDELAVEVWREAGRRLGTALAGLVNLLNPECFIVGGGLARAGAVLFDPMRGAMEALAMNRLGCETPIIEAELGEEAGLIGAATFAMLCSEKGYSPTL